jgi:hypothetical protein
MGSSTLTSLQRGTGTSRATPPALRALADLRPKAGVPSAESDQGWRTGTALQCAMQEVPFNKGPATSFTTAE